MLLPNKFVKINGPVFVGEYCDSRLPSNGQMDKISTDTFYAGALKTYFPNSFEVKIPFLFPCTIFLGFTIPLYSNGEPSQMQRWWQEYIPVIQKKNWGSKSCKLSMAIWLTGACTEILNVVCLPNLCLQLNGRGEGGKNPVVGLIQWETASNAFMSDCRC